MNPSQESKLRELTANLLKCIVLEEVGWRDDGYTPEQNIKTKRLMGKKAPNEWQWFHPFIPFPKGQGHARATCPTFA